MWWHTEVVFSKHHIPVKPTVQAVIKSAHPSTCVCVCVLPSCCWPATPARATVRSVPPHMFFTQKASQQDKCLGFRPDLLLLWSLESLSQHSSSSSTLLLLMCCGIRMNPIPEVWFWALGLYKAEDLSPKLKMGSNYSGCSPDFISMHQFVCSKHTHTHKDMECLCTDPSTLWERRYPESPEKEI